jgi:fructose-1,6-bisphosphatase/inositol monophosphatase family enzyme
MQSFVDAVSQLIRSVGENVVLPRFRTLMASEVTEKSPGEVVTIADRESEERLFEGLARIAGNARLIGEEACADDPALIGQVADGDVWIVDPIDGTANFAAGRAPFGIMVALVSDGLTKACWLHDPLTGRMCHASLGGGAYINGEELVVPDGDRIRPIATLATQFMSENDRAMTNGRTKHLFDIVPIPRCAAEHYPRLCLGENDIALFQRTLPWDHVAGALLLNEAGGRVSRWDGTDYRVNDGKSGLLAAGSDALWERAATALFADGPLPFYQGGDLA